MNLFDYLAASEAKEKAIDRAASGASPEWVTSVSGIIRAFDGEFFTTDDVWRVCQEQGVEEPREPRALGAVMRDLAREGVIVATRDYRPSVRVACHSRPVRVWRRVR